MKIISLNTYGGHVFEPLMEFVERMAPDTDVFCFQEVMNNAHGEFPQPEQGERLNLLSELRSRLPNFQELFSVTQEKFGFDQNDLGSSDEGLAIFVKNELPIAGSGNFFIANGFNSLVGHDYETLGANALYIRLKLGSSMLNICNIHGVSEPANKLDTPKRIAQSQKILDMMSKLPGESVVMGDFNLFPETESIKMFERAGYRNLVVEYNIKTTRGSHMRKLHPQHEHGKYGFQEFADYTFVSPGVHVQSFEVPDEPVSDHLPMILEIDQK
ncbi:MAG: endonuclease/exonuclease/phosphatase family protein [Patescibacteria group bacterium]|jgi:exonuclease III